MDSKTRLLYWLLDGSRGGPTRVRILKLINNKALNTRKLSLELEMDYKTIQGHVELLLENGVIDTPKKGYGSVYFISPEWEDNDHLKKILRGNEYEKEKWKRRKKRN